MLIIKMSLEEPIQKVDLVPVDQNEDNYNEDNHMYAIIGFVVVVVGLAGYLIYYYVSKSKKPSKDSQKPTEEFKDPSKQTNESDPPKNTEKLQVIEEFKVIQGVDLGKFKYNDKPLNDFDKKLLTPTIDWNDMSEDAEIKIWGKDMHILYNNLDYHINLESGEYEHLSDYVNVFKNTDKTVLKKDLNNEEKIEVIKAINFFNQKRLNEFKIFDESNKNTQLYKANKIERLLNVIRIANFDIRCYVDSGNKVIYFVDEISGDYEFSWRVAESIIGQISIDDDKIANDDADKFGCNDIRFRLFDYNNIEVIHKNSSSGFLLGKHKVSIDSICNSDLQKNVILNILKNHSVDHVIKTEKGSKETIKAIVSGLGLITKERLSELISQGKSK